MQDIESRISTTEKRIADVCIRLYETRGLDVVHERDNTIIVHAFALAKVFPFSYLLVTYFLLDGKRS